MPPEQTSLTFAVFLSQSEQSPLDDVDVVVVADRSTFTASSLAAASPAPVTVPASPGAVGVSITSSDVEPGITSGVIYAIVAGTSQQVATLTIERPPKPTFELAGATETGLSFDVTGLDFVRPVVMTMSGASSATVRVTASLADSQSVSVPIEVSLATFSMTDRVNSDLTLSAVLPHLGTFEGFIEITADPDTGQPTGSPATALASASFDIGAGETAATVIPLTVKATEVALNIVIDKPADVHNSAHADPVQVTLVIRGTQSGDVKLDTPVVALAEHDGDRTFAETGNFQMLSPQDHSPVATLMLADNAPTTVLGVLSGVGDAGQHDVTLSFGNASGQPVTTTFSVYTHEPALLAVSLIASGVVLGGVLYLALSFVWHAIMWHRAFKSLLRRVDALHPTTNDAELTQAIAAVRTQINRLSSWQQSLFGQSDADAMTGLTRKVDVLVHYLDVHSKLLVDERNRHEPELSKVVEYLSGGEIATSKGDEIDAALSEVHRAALAERRLINDISALAMTVAQRRELALPDEAAGLDSVTASLETARRSVEADDVEGAEKALLEARESFGKLLLDGLDILLETRPDWFQVERWEQLRDELRPAIATARWREPIERLERYERLARRTIEALSTELAAAIQAKRSKMGPKDPHASALKQAADEVARAQLMTTPSNEALALYNRAATALADASRPSGKKMGVDTAGEAGSPVLPLGLTLNIPSIPSSVIESLARWGRSAVPYVSDAATVLFAVGTVATLLAIAVLSGLELLYVSNPAWGTPTDFLVSFLWGLGLHQVGTGAFTGIRGLISNFTAPDKATT